MKKESAHLGALKIKQDLLQVRRIYPELNEDTGWGNAGGDFQQITEIIHRKDFPVFDYSKIFDAVLRIPQDEVEDTINDTDIEIEGTVRGMVTEIIERNDSGGLLDLKVYLSIIGIGGAVRSRLDNIFQEASLRCQQRRI